MQRPVTPVVVVRGPGHRIHGETFVERDGVLMATSQGMDELVRSLKGRVPRMELDLAPIRVLRQFTERQDAWLNIGE